MANTTVNTMLRTTSGTIYFDALLHADHNASVTPTQHPVQTGAAISDHAYEEPKEISLEVGMTDVISGTGTSVRAYQQFLSLLAKRDPMTVVTRLGAYQNMLLTSVSAPDDYTTMYGLKCTLTFTEIRVVSVATVAVQSQTTGSKTAATPAGTTTKGTTTKGTDAKGTTTKGRTTTPTASTQKSTATVKQSAIKEMVSTLFSSAKTATKATTTKATKPASATVTKKAGNLTILTQ